ncbi:MAG: hypothetical protein KBF45_10560 [Cyclobacteriaceae bacterium]|jgi:hypothetical protein|nr:hypothetical protein [Cyclobacteriaceae bacterium]
MKAFLTFALISMVQIVCAQEFSITRVELAGDKLLIYYDLIDTVKERFYKVHVYSSKDNYLNPIKNVSGAVSSGTILAVAPGSNKKIEWNAKEELGANFEGSIGLEIRGRVYIPFVRLSGFEEGMVVKRGVVFPLTWSGASRNLLNFDLYHDNIMVWQKTGVGNSGSTELIIPTSVKPGDGYRFKISDSKNQDESVYSSVFTVKRKTPLLLKTLPFLVVGGLVYFLLPDNTAKNNEIVGAPCPDGTNDCN